MQAARKALPRISLKKKQPLAPSPTSSPSPSPSPPPPLLPPLVPPPSGLFGQSVSPSSSSSPSSVQSLNSSTASSLNLPPVTSRGSASPTRISPRLSTSSTSSTRSSTSSTCSSLSSPSSSTRTTLGDSELLQVYFSPSATSDFVVHFQGMRFHLHKAVLAAHCSLLLTYPQPQSKSTAPASAKRRKALGSCPQCRETGRCVQLPDGVSALGWDYQDLYLFLKHIYWPQRFDVPPFVRGELGSAFYVEEYDKDTPSFPTFPKPGPWAPLPALTSETLLSEGGAVGVYDSVLEFARLFGATHVLERAQAAMLRRLEVRGARNEAWLYLVHSEECAMPQLKEWCLELITKVGRGVREDEQRANGEGEEGEDDEDEEGAVGGAWVDNWRELVDPRTTTEMYRALLETAMEKLQRAQVQQQPQQGKRPKVTIAKPEGEADY